jgi:hypothetical protein
MSVGACGMAASGSHASHSSVAAGNNTIVDVASGDPQFCRAHPVS